MKVVVVKVSHFFAQKDTKRYPLPFALLLSILFYLLALALMDSLDATVVYSMIFSPNSKPDRGNLSLLTTLSPSNLQYLLSILSTNVAFIPD